MKRPVVVRLALFLAALVVLCGCNQSASVSGIKKTPAVVKAVSK